MIGPYWRHAAPDSWAPVTAFGAKPKIEPPPNPTPMPDLEDPAIKALKRRDLEAAASRSGRASTFLTQGDEYGSTKLGLR